MIKNRLKDIRMKEFAMESGVFAEYIGENFRNYSNWEIGRSKPSLERALIVAKKLNKSVEDIWYIE